jgi:hypothetical protein
MKNITAIGEIIFNVYPGYIKPGGAPLNFIYHIQKLTGKGTLISIKFLIGKSHPEGHSIS